MKIGNGIDHESLGYVASAELPPAQQQNHSTLTDTINQRQAVSRPTSKTTWPKLVRAEPRLIELFREAESISSENDPHFCANQVWSEKLKPQLAVLVGGEVKDHPMLGSSQAYDIASRMVFRVLPGCRDCSCV